MPQANRLIGKIKQAHGLRGEVYVLVFSKDISWIKKLKNIHIVLKNKPQDFNVNKAKPFKDGLILSLETIADRNQSEALVGAEVWIDQNLFKSEPNEPPYLVEIENFLVTDKTLGLVGKITGFSSNGKQDLLVVTTEKWPDSEIIIPFIDQFVLKIDPIEKMILMDLPDGLVEMNAHPEVQSDGKNE